MVLLPIAVFISIIYVKMDLTTARIAVIDNDKTKVTFKLTENLQENYSLDNIKQKDIVDALSNESIEYAVVIDKGFTDKIIKGEKEKINSYYDKDDGTHSIIQDNIMNYIKALNEISLKSNKNSKIFYDNFNMYEEKNYKVNCVQVGNTNKKYVAESLQFFIMLMLFSSINFASILILDREEIKNLRTFAAPITLKNYMFQCILSLFVLEIFQVVVMLIALTIIYGSVTIQYIPLLFTIFTAFSLTSVSIGVFAKSLHSVIKKEAASISITLIVIPMCMLGGCFWGNDMMPITLQYLSNFIPVTWINDAIDAILYYNGNIISVGFNIFVLVLFSIVFFLLGIFTEKDVIR
jgi:ABC-2 type transport system permease protein